MELLLTGKCLSPQSSSGGSSERCVYSTTKDVPDTCRTFELWLTPFKIHYRGSVEGDNQDSRLTPATQVNRLDSPT